MFSYSDDDNDDTILLSVSSAPPSHHSPELSGVVHICLFRRKESIKLQFELFCAACDYFLASTRSNQRLIKVIFKSDFYLLLTVRYFLYF